MVEGPGPEGGRRRPGVNALLQPASISNPSRRTALFPQATDAEWNDWRWQMRHRVRDGEALATMLALTDDERAGCEQTKSIFRLGISPYYLSLIDPDHSFCPVRMQAIPARAEARVREGELLDPLGEDKHRPVEAIVHKYPDRVLFLALDPCSVYFPHSTRRRLTYRGEPDRGISAIAEGGSCMPAPLHSKRSDEAMWSKPGSSHRFSTSGHPRVVPRMPHTPKHNCLRSSCAIGLKFAVMWCM